jgi:heme-degrading monooxygenase HmoA
MMATKNIPKPRNCLIAAIFANTRDPPMGQSRLREAQHEEDEMIARIWGGTATVANADAYHRHFTTRVAPQLNELAGHRGAYLLRRETAGEVEFLAVTLWDSLESIKSFAGPNPELAHVEPAARAVLARFDETARHYEVAYGDA